MKAAAQVMPDMEGAMLDLRSLDESDFVRYGNWAIQSDAALTQAHASEHMINATPCHAMPRRYVRLVYTHIV